MSAFVSLVGMLIQGLIFAIFIRSLISWFPIARESLIVRGLDLVTEPVLEPLRRLIPRIGMIDITPMVAIIVLAVLQAVLTR